MKLSANITLFSVNREFTMIIFLQQFLNPLETVDIGDNFIQTFLLYPHSTISNEVIFLFSNSLQNYWEFLKKCFRCATCIMISLAQLKLREHNRVLLVEEEVKQNYPKNLIKFILSTQAPSLEILLY